MANKNPQFSLRIPPKLRAEIEKAAEDKEVSMTQIILDATRLYLDLQN